MHPDTHLYNQRQDPPLREVCVLLAEAIDRYLPEAENKVWHGHPVWFQAGGYSAHERPVFRPMGGQGSGAWEASVPGHGRPVTAAG